MTTIKCVAPAARSQDHDWRLIQVGHQTRHMSPQKRPKTPQCIYQGRPTNLRSARHRSNDARPAELNSTGVRRGLA